MKSKRHIAIFLAMLIVSAMPLSACQKEGTKENDSLLISYSFDETDGNTTKERVSGKDYKIEYVFDTENQAYLYKEASNPLRRTGVSGNALYMDGFSNAVKNTDFTIPRRAITLSAWVAPRVFENLNNYESYQESTDATGNPRLTSVINKGDIDSCQGFLLGYGRLGLWGVQLALQNDEGEEFVVGYYDPLNTLGLYEWTNIAVSFDSATGYIGLFYNGEVSYEAIIPELQGTKIVSTEEPLYIGKYCSPITEYSVDRQMVSGLLDEIRIYSSSLSPKEIKAQYNAFATSGHPTLEYREIALDSSVYDGDRYRPQYHALPPAAWMNEPHSPFYYKGRYHVFYQHNPSGPYWSQIRWGHLVSDDMIHWEYVKDAIVPTADICPEGVWTGGACIGPDGTPWLVITAGTNQSTWSGQNVAFAHAVDPDDPDLTEWVLEKTTVITQPSDDSQGERDQFRDPFVWYDDGTYYMLVSTSVPGGGGSANVYISEDMREWEYKGYLYECDYEKYPEQGIHWECVVMLPISTKDGKTTKYILFDCPQYASDTYTVDCYYWIGTFDKETCRFIPDDDQPKLFDCGKGIYTGQNGYCFLTDEDIAAGKTEYTQGRTVIYAIAQGKDTDRNKNSGWAHNFAIPLELWLSNDEKQVIREPIKEIESLYGETLYDYEGTGKTAEEINTEISSIRGDMLRIDAEITLAPSAETYSGGLYVRYNPVATSLGTERTKIVFSNDGVYIDRTQTTLWGITENHEDYKPGNVWANTGTQFSVTILLDRSMLEVYVNGVMSFTTRIYPKYGNSDYLRLFDENGGMKVSKLTIHQMKGAYTDKVVPAYYGNVGDLA